MGKPLSTDLRSRLIAAVSGGLSRRAAASRFGVSAASAVRWVFAANSGGPIDAKPQGGDTHSHHIEAFREVILSAIAAKRDITLVELSELLLTRHGASFAASTVWRFLDRHAMTFKKRRTRASRNGQTSPRVEKPGLPPNLISIQLGWSSSMKPGRPPKWPAFAVGHAAASDAGPPFRMGIG